MVTREEMIQYIATEFRRQLDLAPDVPVAVTFTEDEEIIVKVGRRRFVNVILGDEDEFSFTSKSREPIRFPVPRGIAQS